MVERKGCVFCIFISSIPLLRKLPQYAVKITPKAQFIEFVCDEVSPYPREGLLEVEEERARAGFALILDGRSSRC